MKRPVSPSAMETIFGTWEVKYQVPSREGYKTQILVTNTETEANQQIKHYTACDVIYPLQAYCKQQEQIVSVMQLGNSHRSRPLGMLHKNVNALLGMLNLTPAFVADQIQDVLLPLFENSMPGRSSRYYDYATDIKTMMIAFVHKYGTVPVQSYDNSY